MFFLDNRLNRRRVEDFRVISSGRAEQRDGAERWVHDVEMNDGTCLVLLDVIVQQISRAPAHVFSAEIGMYVWGGQDEGGDFISPIIGWSVSHDGNVYPLTSGGSVDDEGDHPIIVLPDGRVTRGGIVQAGSLTEYKASEQNS